MVQDRVTERNASRTIENATHPRATMGAKRMPIDGDRHEAWINRESVGPGSPLAEDNVYTLTPEMDSSSVERMTGIRPSTWPEVAEKARLVRARVAAQYEPMSPERQTAVAFYDDILAFVERQMSADCAQSSLHLEEELIAPEDWPVHGVFVAMLFGAMFWLGTGVSSLIWWLAA